jgi:hypothetical protein
MLGAENQYLLQINLFLKIYFSFYFVTHSAGLTVRQNKNVLGASRGKRVPQKSGHKAIYFISQILGSKTQKKNLM